VARTAVRELGDRDIEDREPEQTSRTCPDELARESAATLRVAQDLDERVRAVIQLALDRAGARLEHADHTPYRRRLPRRICRAPRGHWTKIPLSRDRGSIMLQERHMRDGREISAPPLQNRRGVAGSGDRADRVVHGGQLDRRDRRRCGAKGRPGPGLLHGGDRPSDLR